MTRVNAALLAGAVTVLIFAAAFALINWLTGTAGFWHGIESPLFLLAIIAFNCVALVALVIWSRRRAKRAEKDEPPTPLIRRPPSTGRREL